MAAGLVAVIAGAAAGAWLQAFPADGGPYEAGSPAGRSAPGAFATGRAHEALVTIVGDGQARVAGTPGAASGRGRLAGIFEGLGLHVDRAPFRVDRLGATLDLENLVVTVPGRGAGPARLAVVAHTDGVPGSPGASDDGAGLACAVEVTRLLVEDPPALPVLVVLTDGEERGLLGAQAFVANDPRAKDLRAVVNMDARGASGPAFVFETGPETAWLSGMLASVPGVRSNSLMDAVYSAMPNGTDFTVFRRAGLTGFNIAFIGDVAAYHSPLDTVDRQSRGSLAHMGRTALTLVRALDAALPADGAAVPAGRSVYGDLCGVLVVRWPEGWTIAIVCASVLVAGIALAPGRRAAGALAASLAVVCATAVLGWGLGAAARAAGIGMETAPARLLAMEAALFLAAAIMGVASGVLLARTGCGPGSAITGPWSIWAALAAGAAVAMPAASFPFVLPLVVLAVAAAAARRAPALVALAGTVAAAVVVMPLEPAFMDALGLELGWVNGARAGLVGVTLVPLAVSGRATQKAGNL